MFGNISKEARQHQRTRRQMSVRGVMFAVFVVALIMSAERFRRRWIFCEYWATVHARREGYERDTLHKSEAAERYQREHPEFQVPTRFGDCTSKGTRKRLVREIELKQAYERAKWRAWVPLPVDSLASGIYERHSDSSDLPSLP